MVYETEIQSRREKYRVGKRNIEWASVIWSRGEQHKKLERNIRVREKYRVTETLRLEERNIV